MPMGRHLPDAKAAVLGLHGFGGYPGELALPAGRLVDQGFSVVVPRLPGHGTCQEDFDRSTGRDWYTAAREAYLDLAAVYPTVHLLGHSMGGLLALLLAEEFEVGKMVLMAPAVQLSQRSFPLIGLVSLFRHRMVIPWKSDPSVTFFDDRDPGDDEFLGHEYWGWLNFRKLNEMRRLQVKANRGLSRVTADLLVMTGGKDPTVPEAVGPYLKKRIPGRVEILHLPDASHLVPYDPDTASRERAMDRMAGFFSSC